MKNMKAKVLTLKNIFTAATTLFLLGSAGSVFAQTTEDKTRWGEEGGALRTRASNSSLYYDAARVEKEKEIVRLKLYGTEKPSDQRIVEEVAINCDTHEMTRTPAGGTASAPAKLFAGEALYATARELCGWGAGFWKRLAD